MKNCLTGEVELEGGVGKMELEVDDSMEDRVDDDRDREDK
jgi:hypothetical protein